MVLDADSVHMHDGFGLGLEIIKNAKVTDPKFPGCERIVTQGLSVLRLDVGLMREMRFNRGKHDDSVPRSQGVEVFLALGRILDSVFQEPIHARRPIARADEELILRK